MKTSSFSAPQTSAIAAMQPERRGAIRAVCFDLDPIFSERLRISLDRQHWCHVSGWARNWRHCMDLVDEFVPEILIVRLSAFPSAQLQGLCENLFPAVLGIGVPPTLPEGANIFLPLNSQAEFEEITAVLTRTWLEVCNRKAKDIEILLQSYLAYGASAAPLIECIKVGEREESTKLPLGHIVLFTAYGNYVKVQAHDGEFEIRGTMERLAHGLPTSKFLRIHRCYIVNLEHLRSVRCDSNGIAAVQMANGIEYPVGRSFRVQAAERLMDRIA
jgi:hypothetical protein